ncbi:MAG: Ig-like domain-containing protein, partial [Pseudomonadota bacterium]|nr:Ig-like domain-containing protein [Pseudomonadota bacterium]
MRSKRYPLALMPYWVLAIAMGMASQAASAARCDVDADRDIDRIDIASIHQAVGSFASGVNDPRDGDGDGRILRNDELLCALRCTLPLCELVSGNDGHANRRPLARNDSARTAEDTSVRINVIANDRDPDGRLVARSIKIVTRPRHGRVRNHRNGIVTYTPASGFTGQDRFRYRVRDDDHARSRAARVRMIVERGNRPPLADAGSDTNTTTGLPVTLNGSGSSDPDGDALTFLWRFLSVPPPSTVTDASLANGNSAAPRFTPDVDGPYELAIEASDGAMSAVDSVIVTARAANVPPNANAGPDASAVAGQLVNLDGRGSTDPDNGPAPPGFHWSFTAVPPGSLLSDIDIAGASTALASFTPDFAGDYRISLDVNDGADTGRDEVLISAALPNVAPNADAGTDRVVHLGAPATLNGVASNDPDSGPTPLSFQWTFVSLPPGSGLTDDANLSGATTAAPSFTPDLEGFYLLRLDVSDGVLVDMDQVQVKANVAPVAVDDDAFAVAEDTGLNAPAPGVLGNDTDGTSDPLTAVLNTGVSNGMLTLNPNGSFTYMPVANFQGTDSFTYRANDGTVNSTNPATVTITVSAVDDPPVAINDVATVNEDAPATTIAVLANDTDVDGGAKTVTAVQNPSANGGTVLITNGGADLTYQPAANYCNAPPTTTPDTFTYTLSPGGSTATVSVTVICVDDAPVAVDDVASVNEDAPATTIAVLTNDADLDGGAKTITAVQSLSANGGTVLITNGGADLTYQPAADFCNAPPGTTPDTFTYTLSPGGSIAAVSVTVSCVNDAPVIANLAGDTLAYTQGDPATPIDQGGPTAATDVDSPDFDTGTLTVSLPGGLVAAEDQIGIRNQGTDVNQIGVTGTDVTFNPGIGAVIIGSFSGGGAGGGNLVVTLNTNANAAAVSALLRNVTYVNSNTVAPDIANRTARFVLSDGDGGTSINYDATITVTPNVPPTLDAIADPTAINEDASQQTTNLTGITAGGGESQPLQVTATSNNTGLIPNPTVTYTSPDMTGSLAYTPVANAFGTAIVTVTVTDGGPDGNFGTPDDNGTFSRIFTVTVDAVNDPPTLDAIADPA